MTPFSMTIMVLSLICLVGGTVATSDAATSFNGSTVTGIDQSQRTITFKTKEGETWTLQVADPDILKKQQIAQGDRVSIEIDLNDRITKIVKSSGTPSPSPSPSPSQSAPRDDMAQ